MLRLPGQPVIMRGMHEWLVTGPSPLPPFAGPVDVERSAGHTLPDLFPLLPTIDLKVCHNYTLQHNYGRRLHIKAMDIRCDGYLLPAATVCLLTVTIITIIWASAPNRSHYRGTCTDISWGSLSGHQHRHLVGLIIGAPAPTSRGAHYRGTSTDISWGSLSGHQHRHLVGVIIWTPAPSHGGHYRGTNTSWGHYRGTSTDISWGSLSGHQHRHLVGLIIGAPAPTSRGAHYLGDHYNCCVLYEKVVSISAKCCFYAVHVIS